MFKKEFLGIINSTKSKIFICIVFFIPFIDLLLVFLNSRLFDYMKYPEAYSYHLEGKYILHPALGAFLSGTSNGHITQMIWIWLLPLFILTMYSDSFICEHQRGYSALVLMRETRKNYLLSKMLVSFVFPFILYFNALLVNFLLACLVFRGGSNFLGLEMLKEDSAYFAFEILHPFFSYFCYIIVFSLCAGCCGIMCQSLSFLLKKYKTVYFASFMIWIVLIVMPYSITYLLQPFIEYGPEYMIPPAIFFLLIVIGVFGISYKARIMCDELP